MRFIILEIHLYPGRSDEIKKRMYTVLCDMFEELGNQRRKTSKRDYVRERSVAITVISWLYIVFGGITFLLSVPQLVLYNGFEKGLMKASGEVPQLSIFGIYISFKIALFFLTVICFLIVIAAILMLLRKKVGRSLIIGINTISSILLLVRVIPFVSFSFTSNSADTLVILFYFLIIAFYGVVTVLLFRKKEEFR